MTGVGNEPRTYGEFVADTRRRLVSLERRLTRAGGSPFVLPERLSPPGQQVTDWNNAVETGFYWSDTGALNNPVGNIAVGYVLIKATGTNPRVFQEVSFPSTASTGVVRSWRRVNSSATGTGAWSAWTEVAPVASQAQVDAGTNTTHFVTPATLAVATGVVNPTGAVQMFAGTAAPDGWLLCQGQAVSRTTYAALFALIATTYGAGNGTTTFNVPDLRGRVPAGLNSAETEFDTLGKTGGAKTHTLTTAEIPSHQHPLSPAPLAAQAGGPTNIAANPAYYSATALALTGAAGGGGAHNNLQPYRVLNFIIKT